MKISRATLEAHVQSWVGAVSDKWIPRYVYHFTDVQNAVGVLRSGELMSRAEASARGAMRNDNAASDVIENTPAAHKQFARLYFRPRTPTQWHSEGIRAPADRYHGAHCPVPIFLAFDLIDTLLKDGVNVSNGNMASGRVSFTDTEEFFKTLPFALIYHDGPIAQAQRADIVFHRHAEVLVPRSLAIAPTLRWILCRSHAERETLLYLLGDARQRLEHLVKVGDQKLFYANHFHVDRVEVVGAAPRVSFYLNAPSGRTACVRFQLTSQTSGKTWTWSSDAWSQSVLTIGLAGTEAGPMHLWIEDCLAYAALPSHSDAPF